MDGGAIERAKTRIENGAARRTDAASVDAVLERAREQVEALAATAAELESSLPGRIDAAIHDGVREEARPLGRNLAEIRGLMNQVIRRLERLEGDLLAERHARVDDLTLLVDLITSGWKGVDGRLGRVETILTRLEQRLQERGGAIVYRIEDRRPDVANGP
jgi:chromosome segregation ATPase